MREIHDLAQLEAALRSPDGLRDVMLQGIDLTSAADSLAQAPLEGAVLLGCRAPDALVAALQRRGVLVFPRLPELPFDPYRAELYQPDELFAGFDPDDPCSYCSTLDARVYAHWEAQGREDPPRIVETLARRLHDHSITDALGELLARDGARERTIAIMGGHSLQRGDARYRDVARIARQLTREGFFLASGGGPGAMEATHLGAWFADRGEPELDAAVAALSVAPHYRDLQWLSTAFRVRDASPPPGHRHTSVGIPTWLYGHEPPNPFATHIAKYFANSVREDGLVTIAVRGILYAPGSAGTIQEVFQDATQNHYGTVGLISPMVFLDRRFWEEERPVVPMLRGMAGDRPYARLLTALDGVDEIVRFFVDHPPVPAEDGGWSFCREHCLDHSNRESKAQP